MKMFENPAEKRLRAPFRLSFFILGISFIWMGTGILQATLRGIGPNWLMMSVSYMFTALLTTGLVYLTGRWMDFRSFSAFGFNQTRLWYNELVEAMVITSGVVLVVFATGFLLGIFEVSGLRPGLVSPEKWIPAFIGYFIMMVCVAYYEELIFRGYLTLNLFEGLQQNLLKFRAAALGSTFVISALFAVVHLNNPNATWIGVMNILLAGFMLGLPFFISGSLATPIGIHFAWNFVQGPVLGLPVSGIIFHSSLIQTNALQPYLFSGGNFGLEGGLLGSITIILTTLLVFVRYQNRYALNQVHPAIMAQPIIRKHQQVSEPVNLGE